VLFEKMKRKGVIMEEQLSILVVDDEAYMTEMLQTFFEMNDNYASTSAVIMTGFSEEYTTSEALNSGADGYITKPFRNKELLLILRRIRQLSDFG